MGPYGESTITNRSRSIPRRRPHRQSRPCLGGGGGVSEEAALIKIQAIMGGIVKKEMNQMWKSMSKMNADHIEMQNQAAGIARYVKNALQTLAAQQQHLALTPNQESQKIHQVANDQSSIVEGMYILDRQQVKRPHRLGNRQDAVQSLGQRQVHLIDEVKQTADGQDNLKANAREGRIKARECLQELQKSMEK